MSGLPVNDETVIDEVNWDDRGRLGSLHRSRVAPLGASMSQVVGLGCHA